MVEELEKKIFSRMSKDEKGMIARKDQMIRAYGERQLFKYKHDGGDIYANISGHMRSLAELLIQIKQDNPEITSWRDCVHYSKYMMVSRKLNDTIPPTINRTAST